MHIPFRFFLPSTLQTIDINQGNGHLFQTKNQIILPHTGI